MDNSDSLAYQQAKAWFDRLEECDPWDTDPETGNSYVLDVWDDALDIEFIVGSDGGYKACEVMVTCGGPNVYLSTRGSGCIEAYWDVEVSLLLPEEWQDALDELGSEYCECVR